MTSETRYMRYYTEIVGGLLYRILGTILDTPYSGHETAGDGDVTVYWGILVWKYHSDDTKTEITAGTPVAQVNRPTDGVGIQSNTWDCPETDLEPTDRILVVVYIKVGTGSWVPLPQYGFITEQLGADTLDAVTWTVYYHTERAYLAKLDVTTGRFRHGNATYNSRITNFCYEPAVVPFPGGLNPIQIAKVILDN